MEQPGAVGGEAGGGGDGAGSTATEVTVVITGSLVTVMLSQADAVELLARVEEAREAATPLLALAEAVAMVTLMTTLAAATWTPTSVTETPACSANALPILSCSAVPKSETSPAATIKTATAYSSVNVSPGGTGGYAGEGLVGSGRLGGGDGGDGRLGGGESGGDGRLGGGESGGESGGGGGGGASGGYAGYEVHTIQPMQLRDSLSIRVAMAYPEIVVLSIGPPFVNSCTTYS